MRKQLAGIPPEKRRKVLWGVGIVVAVLVVLGLYTGRASFPVQVAPTKAVSTATPAVKASATPSPTGTSIPPTDVPPTDVPATPVAPGTPYAAAPACAEHSTSDYHSLWNSAAGCHYDHEHGEDAFTSEVAATFPGFDLLALLGGVHVGHSHPSSPAENVAKHGGFKWQVQTVTPRGCFTGFESAEHGIDAVAIQYHAFGNYAIEFESRVHSTAALLRQCLPGSDDFGYIFTIQHQDYGQRVIPYQGQIMPYPNNPAPYPSPRGPYFTLDCFGPVVQCRESLSLVTSRRLNASSIWTSKGGNVLQQGIFNLLFRIRDTYQLLDWADQEYPFTFAFLCSADGGITYAPAGCRYNNSTSRVHEIAGVIPAAWDGAAWDTDARSGRVTGEAMIAGFPVKLVSAYAGTYGTQLIADKLDQFSPEAQPERDLCFQPDGQAVNCDTGGTPSGWIGEGN